MVKESIKNLENFEFLSGQGFFHTHCGVHAVRKNCF